MFNLVEIEPTEFLTTSAPANSRTLEVSPQVSMSDLPLEDQGATRDGTC